MQGYQENMMKKYPPSNCLGLSSLFLSSILWLFSSASHAKENPILVLSMNAASYSDKCQPSGCVHKKEAYQDFFGALKNDHQDDVDDFDFITTVEMTPGIEGNFITSLKNVFSNANIKSIGRIRGGTPDASPDEMARIYYNANRWTLEEYQNVDKNPVLANSCDDYRFEMNGNSKPCALASASFDPNQYPYTFQLNYTLKVDGQNTHYFPGDESPPWGPWNRIAVFALFKQTNDSNKKLILINTHFPKGKNSNTVQKKVAFDAINQHILLKLLAHSPNTPVIFTGDLNYQPQRDQNDYDLFTYIKDTSVLKGTFNGEPSDVMWTIHSTEIDVVANKSYALDEVFSISDHVINATLFQF